MYGVMWPLYFKWKLCVLNHLFFNQLVEMQPLSHNYRLSEWKVKKNNHLILHIHKENCKNFCSVWWNGTVNAPPTRWDLLDKKCSNKQHRCLPSLRGPPLTHRRLLQPGKQACCNSSGEEAELVSVTSVSFQVPDLKWLLQTTFLKIESAGNSNFKRITRPQSNIKTHVVYWP